MKWTRLSLATASLFGLAVAGSKNKIQIGQQVIYSYPGETPPEHLFDLIRAGQVGGLILFGENVNDELPATIEQFLSAYRESPAYADLKTPFLIMTDQEGGQVRRLPGAPVESAKEVGESADPVAAAGRAGAGAAETLLRYNMNANLAPVLDVYREEGDFTDNYERSFSNDATVVAGCAAQFVRDQQRAKVLATAKHFPGLGAAKKDENTDARPVTIDLTLEEIRAVDEVPYHDAIGAGIAMIMPSWAIYPAFDAERPAGLSSRWIRDELRGRLGFDGVIVTDAIEAGSLKAFGDDADRALLAKKAGVDLILASGRNVTQGESIVSALAAALENGDLSQQELDASDKRVQAARAKLA
ncbi:glycoside hydrolase family 3 protein [Thermothelomyces thermophilus ATCC 42464]|uniref:Glycoside hydrolase family 3 protein n=1 Tax=Thermothelomyces thermophilus (strain ATCC 42464 / BCRC 31852 / DSM 1799) TaxID=573729 RepID=G2QQB5_THET4|nr:glycoside hydrolase family 3 protein [Thermothelomyces thermophilus ATCC 42464]AEO61778.1 glycoside hydrolase family 3 protein [Thermothelomyces thermophilus ATCC 42464]